MPPRTEPALKNHSGYVSALEMYKERMNIEIIDSKIKKLLADYGQASTFVEAQLAKNDYMPLLELLAVPAIAHPLLQFTGNASNENVIFQKSAVPFDLLPTSVLEELAGLLVFRIKVDGKLKDEVKRKILDNYDIWITQSCIAEKYCSVVVDTNNPSKGSSLQDSLEHSQWELLSFSLNADERMSRLRYLQEEARKGTNLGEMINLYRKSQAVSESIIGDQSSKLGKWLNKTEKVAENLDNPDSYINTRVANIIGQKVKTRLLEQVADGQTFTIKEFLELLNQDDFPLQAWTSEDEAKQVQQKFDTWYHDIFGAGTSSYFPIIGFGPNAALRPFSHGIGNNKNPDEVISYITISGNLPSGVLKADLAHEYVHRIHNQQVPPYEFIPPEVLEYLAQGLQSHFYEQALGEQYVAPELLARALQSVTTRVRSIISADVWEGIHLGKSNEVIEKNIREKAKKYLQFTLRVGDKTIKINFSDIVAPALLVSLDPRDGQGYDQSPDLTCKSVCDNFFSWDENHTDHWLKNPEYVAVFKRALTISSEEHNTRAEAQSLADFWLQLLQKAKAQIDQEKSTTPNQD